MWGYAQTVDGPGPPRAVNVTSCIVLIFTVSGAATMGRDIANQPANEEQGEHNNNGAATATSQARVVQPLTAEKPNANAGSPKTAGTHKRYSWRSKARRA